MSRRPSVIGERGAHAFGRGAQALHEIIGGLRIERERDDSGVLARREAGQVRREFGGGEHGARGTIEMREVGKVGGGNPEVESGETEGVPAEERGDVSAGGAVEFARAQGAGRGIEVDAASAKGGGPGDGVARAGEPGGAVHGGEAGEGEAEVEREHGEL